MRRHSVRFAAPLLHSVNTVNIVIRNPHEIGRVDAAPPAWVDDPEERASIIAEACGRLIDPSQRGTPDDWAGRQAWGDWWYQTLNAWLGAGLSAETARARAWGEAVALFRLHYPGRDAEVGLRALGIAGMNAPSFVPWAAGMDKLERVAKCRSMRAIAAIIAGPGRGHRSNLSAADAEQDDAALIPSSETVICRNQ